MRALFIYFTSFILLTYSYHLQEIRGFSKYKKEDNSILKSQIVRDREQSLYDHFRDQELVPFLMGIIFGKTQGMAPDMKEDFGRLYLQHLFTPSGLHLSAIFLFLWPIKRFSRKKLYHKILSLCCFLIFFLPDFYAFKRMALFRLVLIFFSYLRLKNSYPLFLLSFSLDFLFGTFHSSPLSFAYSFVFLGLIMAYPRLYPKRFLIFYLLCGEILVCYFQKTPLLGLGFLFNSGVSTLFSLIYPLIFLLYLMHLDFLLEWLLYYFTSLVGILSHFSLHTGFFNSTIPLLLACVLFFIGEYIPLKYFLFLGLFLLHSEGLE